MSTTRRDFWKVVAGFGALFGIGSTVNASEALKETPKSNEKAWTDPISLMDYIYSKKSYIDSKMGACIVPILQEMVDKNIGLGDSEEGKVRAFSICQRGSPVQLASKRFDYNVEFPVCCFKTIPATLKPTSSGVDLINEEIDLMVDAMISEMNNNAPLASGRGKVDFLVESDFRSLRINVIMVCSMKAKHGKKA